LGVCLIDAGYVSTRFPAQLKPSESHYSNQSSHPIVCCHSYSVCSGACGIHVHIRRSVIQSRLLLLTKNTWILSRDSFSEASRIFNFFGNDTLKISIVKKGGSRTISLDSHTSDLTQLKQSESLLLYLRIGKPNKRMGTSSTSHYPAAVYSS
jgi:hypothetical protein